jgi:alkylation response protein AidB-like acyl-CoA dehydrogenase
MAGDVIAIAEDIAERVLLPAAMDVDAADLAPRAHFDLLAEAGLFGLAGPEGVNLPALTAVIERLASGCLTTAFVWIQHHTPVRELTASGNDTLRDEWLPELCSGRKRAGIALGGLQMGAAGLKAEPAEGGWLISGVAPYATGWGLIDVLLAAAMTPDGRVLRALIDARASAALRPEPLRLIAANASGTVRLHLDRLFVPEERVTSLAPYTPPPPYDGGGRPNGSLALGVTRRCLAMIGPSPLDAELTQVRNGLDNASDREMATARAAAAELALRAASALIVSQGSTSIVEGQHANRLYREAAFLLVFGTRAATRQALLRRLGGA